MLVGVWVSPAAAQTPERDYNRLEYGLKRSLIRLDVLEDRLDNVASAADLVEEIIQDQNDAGKDTTALEEALADFRNAIAEAQGKYDEAAQVLADKAGFDEDGEVTDPEQARDTLESANRAFQDANQALRTARQDLRQAIRDYRQSNRTNW